MDLLISKKKKLQKGRITNSSNGEKKISEQGHTIKDDHCYNSNRVIAWREKTRDRWFN
jgi:hypothetical protein